MVFGPAASQNKDGATIAQALIDMMSGVARAWLQTDAGEQSCCLQAQETNIYSSVKVHIHIDSLRIAILFCCVQL